MRRKPIVLLLALAIVFAACGDDDTTVTEAPSSSSSSTPVSVGGSDSDGQTDPGPETGSVDTADAGEPTTMWVTDLPGGRLAQVDLGSSTCRLTEVGLSAEYVALGIGGLWITDGLAQQLVFADPDSGEVLGRRNVEGWPSDLALSETSVWPAIPDTTRVLEIDPDGGEVIAEIPFDEPPSAIALGSYAVGTWDGSVYFDDLDEGVGWVRDMGGSIYDAQFYGGLLWVLVVFFDGEHNPTGSEIWVIDPIANEALLFDAVDDFLSGILVDDYGVWANSLEQDEVAWWVQANPGMDPAADKPYWAAADSPSKWRSGGKDIFTVHHKSGGATQVARQNLDHDWGLQRSQGDAPSLWDQPGTTYYDLRSLCGDDTIGPADVAAATASEIQDAVDVTRAPWDSDSIPEGPAGETSTFFSSCRTTTSSHGPVSAEGTLTNADEGATVMFSVIDSDGTSYLLGATTIDSAGDFEFEEKTPPVSPPFVLELVSGTAQCETPVE